MTPSNQSSGGMLARESGGRVYAWVAAEVTAAYDLSRVDDLARLEPQQRLAQVLYEQAGYVDRMLGLMPGESVALRWVRAEPGRLRLWLVARTESATGPAAHGRCQVLVSMLSQVPGHVLVQPVEGVGDIERVLEPFTPVASGLVQVVKRVRMQEPERPDAGVRHYLAVEPFARQPQDWNPFLEALAGCAHPVALTVMLSPQVVPVEMRRMLESEATRYTRLAEPLELPADVGGSIRYPADGGATVLKPIFQDALHRYTDRVFRFTITLASPQPLDGTLVEALGRTVSTGGSAPDRHDPSQVSSGYAAARPASADEYETLCAAHATVAPVVLPDRNLQQWLAPDRDRDRESLTLLRAMVDRAEAMSLFRLPAAVDGHLPGLRVQTRPDRQRVTTRPSGPRLLIGYQDAQRSPASEVALPVTALPRHGFIVGTPGSGKTNTALHLCRQLWAHRIPFLVVEPVNAALDDYRWLATLPEFDDLILFTVGDEYTAPLRLNPFQPPPRATVTSHISNLLACFEAAFGLWDPLPFIYRRALTRTYQRRGLHPEDQGSRDRDWPVLAEFVATLGEVTAELGYRGEIGHNIDAAGRLRAEALIEGACGSSLDCRRSFDLDALLTRPVVVELAGVGDNAKEQALVTLLLLNAVRGHRRALAHRPDTPHVMIIEEAHRVFPRASDASGQGPVMEGNARALAAERIAQGLAEDRKYGQAYLLIDQQVGKVSEDAYKITNLKVMHRTSAEQDRRLLAATMTMHSEQFEAAAALVPFHAVVSHNDLDQAVTVQVPDVRGEDATARGLAEAPLADDEQLRQRHARLLAEPVFAEAMAPYEVCHGCRHRCAFRRHAASIASDQAAAGRLLALAQPGAGGWPAVARELRQMAGAAPRGIGPEATIDYQMCVFIHAFRTAHPAAVWSREDRRRAVRWADRARAELSRVSAA